MNCKSFVEEAQMAYRDYCVKMHRILVMYGVRDEAQIFSRSLHQFESVGKEDVRECSLVIKVFFLFFQF